jgi:hypothetical protein
MVVLLVAGDGSDVGSAPSPALGPPSSVYRVGGTTVYVFPYDLAQRLSPP